MLLPAGYDVEGLKAERLGASHDGAYISHVDDSLYDGGDAARALLDDGLDAVTTLLRQKSRQLLHDLVRCKAASAEQESIVVLR